MSDLICPTGIAGFDSILRGGLPLGKSTVVCGTPGSGKTVIGMQFLFNGMAEHQEPGIMISFEESPAGLARNFRSIDASSPGLVEHGVYFIDARLPDDTVETGSFDLGGLIAIATATAQRHGVKRIVIDGIDALFAVAYQSAHRRREILRILHWLAESEFTAVLTMKADSMTAGIPEYFDFAEFAADAVVRLRSTIVRELLCRRLEVIKLRGAEFVEGEHPYIISREGVRVLYSPPRTAIGGVISGERLSSGVERLDAMLQGGYRSGTTTLISGLPGTSKTSLGAEFVAAGCRNGERCLFVGFDEPAEQMIFEANSIGNDLAPYQKSGLFLAESFSAGSAIGDKHYLMIERLIDEHRPSRVVVDPISALVKSGGPDMADVVTERLVSLFKLRGITAVFTAVSETSKGEVEGSPTRISTIADNWIHLSFAIQRGERNRTLTVVKARGTGHSNQLREVILSNDGITLADVYRLGGDVLLGTARFQREQADDVARSEEENKAEVRLAELDDERKNLVRQADDAARRLTDLDELRKTLVERRTGSLETDVIDSAAVHALRHGDPAAE